MLIKALCDYYEMLDSQGKVVPKGFSQVGVSYLISLKENGSLDSIIDIRENVNGYRQPRELLILKRDEISAIHSNFIDHRGLYIFGLNYDADENVLTPNDPKKSKTKNDAARKKHEAFVETNLEFISNISSPVIDAFRSFLKNWSPEKEVENPLLVSIGKDIEKTNFVFCLAGHPDMLLHEDKMILEKWEKIFREQQNNIIDENVHQCAVLGENLEIANLHNSIKGIQGGQASGTKVVCFNNDSENSYCKTQSLNSNVSKLAMEQYTEALNYLLASKNNHQIVDDTTVVYWAQSGNKKADDLMYFLTFGDKEDVDDEILSSLIREVQSGQLTDERIQNFEKLDLNTDYYFVGIKPNASRLSLKFIYKKQLRGFLLNSAQHQRDMKIERLDKAVPVWRLKEELFSPNATKERVNPALVSKLFDSILNGTPYPNELLQRIVQRVKMDVFGDKDKNKNWDIKNNPIRAGIIKACINRKIRFNKKEEEITMSLNKENKNQAYLCGRLFAVLEQIQQKATNYSLNRTIKDTYFASAIARPASVFPKTIKLVNYHLSKLGNPKYFCDEILEITEKLGNEFPITLPLVEQGKFILGYYHQINNKNNTEEK